jgi:nucleoside 2-deoxyribosyltransferase
MRIYLAGPISGNGYQETIALFTSKIEPLEAVGYEVTHPMLGKEYLRNELEFRTHGYGHPVSTNHAIYERDRWMVQSADIVFADLYGANRVSIGTMFELAWASQLGKHTVVVLPENGPHPHAHCFVLEAADIIFSKTQDALDYLVQLRSSYGNH